MSKIKTRDTTKNIKVFDRAANVGKRMKDAYVKSKDAVSSVDSQAERTQDTGHNSPSEYASDQIMGRARDAAERTARGLKKNPVKKASENVNKAKENFQEVKQQMNNIRDAVKKPAADQPKKEMVRRAKETARRTASRTRQAADSSSQAVYRSFHPYGQKLTHSAAPPLPKMSYDFLGAPLKTAQQSKNTLKGTEKTVKGAVHGSSKTIKTASKTIKGTAKATRNTVKTAERTAKVTVKTVQQTAKATQRAAQAAVRAAKVAAQAAKAAAKAAIQAAKIAAKVLMAIIKMIIAATKALIAAIAAGGWVAVVIILVICLIGLLLGSIFGIFFSNETDESQPMSMAIAQVDAEFQAGIDARIEELKAGGVYDEVRVFYDGDGDGDSSHVNNWCDVLAVYAVLLNTDETEGMEVLTVTPEKIERLKQTFEDMNEVQYGTQVIQEEQTQTNWEGEEETVTISILIIRVNINSFTYEQAADNYHMSEEQRDLLDELMQPEYASLFAALLGVDVFGGANLTDIISGLPAGTMGADVIQAAVQKLGCSYVWGAKGPDKFDCSGFVYWAINEVNASLGSQFRTSAAGQAKWCYDNGRTVGRNELQPGDLVFWQNLGCSGCSRWEEIHHVGIYVGDGKVLEASSSKGRVLIRDLWESSGYPIFMFARLS